jgi:hypothetical protein
VTTPRRRAHDGYRRLPAAAGLHKRVGDDGFCRLRNRLA